jgi:hypothetical protein
MVWQGSIESVLCKGGQAAGGSRAPRWAVVATAQVNGKTNAAGGAAAGAKKGAQKTKRTMTTIKRGRQLPCVSMSLSKSVRVRRGGAFGH